MLVFSDVYTAAARRGAMRGQETRELVGLGDWDIRTSGLPDYSQPAGVFATEPATLPGTSAYVPEGTGVLLPQNIPTAPPVEARATPSSPTLPRLTAPTVLGGVIVLGLGLMLLGGKK